MTQAQLLQLQVMSDFFNRLCNLSDNELVIKKVEAQETQDGKRIKAINKEMNRRNFEQ